LNANTTYAAFQADARVIDPAGFTARPREPLAAAAFALALPSPAFAASRLDATRPVLRAGSTRVTPVLRGVTYRDPGEELPAQPQPQPRAVTAAHPVRPQPVIVINQPAPEPEEVAVPVPYPVIAGLFTVTPPGKAARKTASTTSVPPAAPAAPAPVARQPHKKLRDRGEGEIYNLILSEEDNPGKQLVDLDSWTHRYRDSDFDDDRTVIYMHAYSKTGHPDKVVELGSRLLSRGLANLFTEPAQILSVLYLTTVSADQLPHPNRDQRQAFHAASQELLTYVPIFFAPERKPANLSEADWKTARFYMENTARKVLAMETR
jgi:hypothetical protein